MHYVYVLRSDRYKGKTYVGVTDNLEKRIKVHNSGGCSYTKKYMPYKVVYYEAFANREDAVEREIKLKHHGSVIGHLKKRIKRSLES